jgi:hypothetical protein
MIRKADAAVPVAGLLAIAVLGIAPDSRVTAEIDAEAIHVFPAAGTTRRTAEGGGQRSSLCYALVRRFGDAGTAASRFFAAGAGRFGVCAEARAVPARAASPFGRAVSRAISASACSQWASALSAGRPSPSQIA